MRLCAKHAHTPIPNIETHKWEKNKIFLDETMILLVYWLHPIALDVFMYLTHLTHGASTRTFLVANRLCYSAVSGTWGLWTHPHSTVGMGDIRNDW